MKKLILTATEELRIAENVFYQFDVVPATHQPVGAQGSSVVPMKQKLACEICDLLVPKIARACDAASLSLSRKGRADRDRVRGRGQIHRFTWCRNAQ